MEEAYSSRCSLLIFLVISGILTFINIIEFYNFLAYLNEETLISSPLFEQCIRFELILKTVFSFLSLFSSFSAFLLTSFLIINMNYFIEKLSTSFLKCNYYIFGPVLLAFSILAILNIENLVYSCDKSNTNCSNKLFSFSNLIAIILCFLISFILTILVEFFNCVTIFIDSILRKSIGNQLLGKFFWLFISLYQYLISNNNTNNNLNSNRETQIIENDNNDFNIYNTENDFGLRNDSNIFNNNIESNLTITILDKVSNERNITYNNFNKFSNENFEVINKGEDIKNNFEKISIFEMNKEELKNLSDCK